MIVHARTIFAIIFALAFIATAQGQIPAVVSRPGQVVEQVVPYDLGFRTREQVYHRAPKGKADTLIVYSAAWCPPCQKMRPTWESLRSQGYQIVYIDVDHPYEQVDKYPYATRQLISDAMKDRPKAVPTVKWYNSESGQQVGDIHVGTISENKVKELLWNPSLSADSVPGLLPSFFARPRLWDGYESYPISRNP